MNSSIASTVSEPYAEALMSLAQSRSATEKFATDTKDFLNLLRESAELSSFLSNPIVGGSDKKAVLQRVVGDSVDPMFTNFLMLLVDRSRIQVIGDVCERYQAAYRKLTGTVLAEITSASPLSPEQETAISDRVRGITNANAVELSVKVDGDLLGGVIIKFGSQIIDSSLRSQLRRIGLSLK
jgi:F-type H+-transporting ATPase subunit delta